MKIQNLLILIFALIFSNCSDDTHKPETCDANAAVTIVSSTNGGWLGSYDSMNIHQQTINYQGHCGDNNDHKSYSISCDEWNPLISKINIADFNDLDIHTCNACIDGVDYSISIKTDTSYHKITFGQEFGKSNSVIKNLYTEIEKLRTQFIGNICPY